MGKFERISTLDDVLIGEVATALHAVGSLVATEAQISITTGAVSGKGHVPSRPGEPPNNDTGTLANGIVVIQPLPLRVEVRSTAPYAAALEYGTSKMGDRPYLRPARDRSVREAQRIMARAVNRALRKTFGK